MAVHVGGIGVGGMVVDWCHCEGVYIGVYLLSKGGRKRVPSAADKYLPASQSTCGGLKWGEPPPPPPRRTFFLPSIPNHTTFVADDLNYNEPTFRAINKAILECGYGIFAPDAITFRGSMTGSFPRQPAVNSVGLPHSVRFPR